MSRPQPAPGQKITEGLRPAENLLTGGQSHRFRAGDYAMAALALLVVGLVAGCYLGVAVAG